MLLWAKNEQFARAESRIGDAAPTTALSLWKTHSQMINA
jgi:hypothetical protein